MTATVPTPSKITYTSANVDWGSFHRQFDDALMRVRAQLGRDYPLYIGGDAVSSGGPPIIDASPIDTSVTLGRFATGTPEQVGRAVVAARAAQREWAHRPWRDRVATLRKAASLIRERKFELAAIMTLEVGKSRPESMGDAEESADLIDYYCQELADANGFVRERSRGRRCGVTRASTASCSRARRPSECTSTGASPGNGSSRACSRWAGRTLRSSWIRPTSMLRRRG